MAFFTLSLFSMKNFSPGGLIGIAGTSGPHSLRIGASSSIQHLFRDDRGHFRTDAARLVVLMDNKHFARAANRLENRLPYPEAAACADREYALRCLPLRNSSAACIAKCSGML